MALSDSAFGSSSAPFRPPQIRGVNCVRPRDYARARHTFGINAVRYFMTPQNMANSMGISVGHAWHLQLQLLESALREAAREGVWVIIDLHQPPNPDRIAFQRPEFWANDANLDVLIRAWRDIVRVAWPYREFVWGYDLLNEPYNRAELPLGASKWPAWAQSIVDDVRTRDATTPIVLEPGPGAMPRGFIENEWIDAGPGYPVLYQGDFPLIDDPRVIYSPHVYDPYPYSHQGLGTFNQAPTSSDWPDKTSYPGVIGDAHWDKDRLRALLEPVVRVQRKYRVPIFVGEFSAIRWAPGAAQYVNDLIELFEEYEWSWAYHAFTEWHGWDTEFTEQMTSDANRLVARAAQPTDRELIVKGYFARNAHRTPGDFPAQPNLLSNPDFSGDFDSNGLADWWTKGTYAAASLVDGVQHVACSNSGKGVDQQWIGVSDQHRYLLRARVRVDGPGSLRFWCQDATETSVVLGDRSVAHVSPTNGAFTTRQLEFVPTPGTGRVSIRFWANTATTFDVDFAELVDLGPAVVAHPPRTTATMPGADTVTFTAQAFDGASVARAEYRIVGQGTQWHPVPPGGLTFSPGNTYVVGYRSVDTAGLVEPAQSIVVGRAAH
ncbi:glycoside hydrolase family 5 protein [Allorhizocola rhizosphaerae]|uniref:glycoside hydrolase family 5 protein n=1 Tax=Allorhizocola rhizosphaerae TaxID=1872709 RepID=UPI0013C3435F|nr:cellulase family glycosylhydrolase [Allorhizocola rhizosphaerae]